jgi:PAS domain S-box-containing protein
MENLFQMLADAADGAFVVNKNQYIIYWNLAAQKMLGYAPNKVVGRPCYEVLRGCNEKGQVICTHHCTVMTAVSAGKPIYDYDLVTCTRSGDMRWINVSILTTCLTQDRSSPLVVHLFRDATQSKQNEQLVKQMFTNVDDQPAFGASGNQSSQNAAPRLTKRENEVLSLLAQSFSTSEIAKTLSISSATVRNHIQNILHNLQVHSRLEAVIFAQQNHLLE